MHGNVSVNVFRASGGSRALGRGESPRLPRPAVAGALRPDPPSSSSKAKDTARARWGDERGADYVFSDLALDVRARNNLAPFARATQSSTDFNGDAHKAIDGNTDPYFTHGSVTHTAAQPTYVVVENDELVAAPPPYFELEVASRHDPRDRHDQALEPPGAPGGLGGASVDPGGLWALPRR